MNNKTARQDAISSISEKEIQKSAYDHLQEPAAQMFGNKVFSDYLMKQRLPKAIYKSLKKTIEEGNPLEPEVADVVANTMKEWAVEHGATHFSHWFHPMTGLTAEKHDSFVTPQSDGRAMMEFHGKELVKGEPDASSFPSGGIRSTFEARGYTAWDATSPAFIRDTTLCIPTAFYSYTGEVLDKKTPLLKSMYALSEQAMRVLKLFGNATSKRVITTVGPEQEYFLIDKQFFYLREDLVMTGRTLFGAKPPKGQESEDHYFGSIKTRIMECLKEIDAELWQLGVNVRTRHNEVAPAQYEIAPIFSTSNIAMDHNQIVMDTLKKVANRHGLACLLHEKPFAGVNGSGKHNNWSMATDDGFNLLDPGDDPYQNAQFMVFLVAVITAVDKHGDLLRAAVANPGNDHRLGANEAPPAIISIFLGDQLTEIIEQLETTGHTKDSGKGGKKMEIGVTTLPPIPKDATDRNRTSPFAFTGNKFEFRAVPSSLSLGGPNIVLNTIVAESLDELATQLENSIKGGKTLEKAVQEILSEKIKKHKRIIYNGDNYVQEWIDEASKRGLPNLKTVPDALPILLEQKNVDIFAKYKIFSPRETESRYNVLVEIYNKTINQEALCTLNIGKRQILPACIRYQGEVAKSLAAVKSVSSNSEIKPQEEYLKELSSLNSQLATKLVELDKILGHEDEDILKHAKYFRDTVLPKMSEVRQVADKLETMVDSQFWPLPSYAEMLFLI
ncbi:MAG: glutamine synthetase III [Leptospiraceae bacterium]|nr:glutamine synthetase III [Leptospiraceae bacterium]MCP5494979.1 glutamine synthetase III [Leptospiraceae bacterium]